MANSEYTIRVKVAGGADVDAIKRALEGLGATVSRTRTSIGGADRASQDFHDTQKKGIIGTANSTKSFSKLAETIGRNGSSGLVGAYATLAANVFAVSAAFNALRGASQVEQIFRGLEAAGARTGLSLNTTAMALRDVTGAAISTEQAMRSTAQIVSAGFSGETVERLGKAARDASFALGRNMTDSLDRLSRGVVKLEPELLDELGIMTKLTESNTRYAQTLGKTESQLSGFEKRTGFLNAVLAEAELKFGGLSEAAGNSANYDKLIAKVTDTSNSFLNFINIFGKPLAGILAGSSYTIAGSFALAIASLKNQLVPSLAAAVTRSKEFAAASREDAKVQLERAKATSAYAAAQRQAGLATQANFKFIGDRGASVYRANREEILRTIGTTEALTKAQQKGLNSLATSIRLNEQVLASNPAFATGTVKGDAKRLEQENLKKELAAVKELQAARRVAATEDVRSLQAVADARRAALSATIMARAQESASASIGAAASLNLTKSWDYLTQAVKRYYTAQVLATTTGVAGMTALQRSTVLARTAVFALSTGMKALGTAVLTALPWIGLLTVAFGLLKTAWNAMKSDAVKKLEKDLESFNEVAAKAVQYGNEIERSNNALISSSIRTAQAVTIQSNAVREIAEAYQEVLASQDKVNGEGILENLVDGLTGAENSSKTVASFWETLGSRNILSYQLGIRRNSKVLDLAMILPQSADASSKEALKTLNTLNEAAPKDLDRWVVRNYGSWAELNKQVEKNPALIKKVADTASQSLNKSLGAAAENVKALQEAFKQLESDLSTFYRSAAISTPFDGVVKSVTSANTAIIMLADSMKDSGSEWKGLLTSLDGNTSSSLSVGLQKDLKTFADIDLKLQEAGKKARDLAAEGEKNGVSQENIAKQTEYLAALEAKRLVTQAKLGDRVREELMTVENRFLVAQETTRQTAAQLTLLQAQIGANSEIYKGGAAGMRAKIADEEKVRNLQKAQLRVQIDVLQASVALNDSKAASLKQQIVGNEQLLKTLELTSELNRETARGTLSQRGIGSAALATFQKAGYDSKGARLVLKKPIDEETASLLDSYLKDTGELAKKTDEILKQKTELRGVELASRDINASIKSLHTQIAAIDAANLTTAEKQAAYQRAELELRSGALTSLRAQQKALEEINTTYEDINALVAGVNDTLGYQVESIKRAAVLQREVAAREYSDKQRDLQLSLREAEAQASKALGTADQKKAAESLVISAKEAIGVAEQDYGISLQKIEAQEKLAVLQKVIFDTQKEGLQWQQDALNIVQKQLDAQRELATAIGDSYSLRQKLDAKRRGFEVSQAGEDAAEIKAAETAYKLAVSEVNVKKSLIDLEYALLDAQKDQLLDELKVRRMSIPNDAQNATRIAQLDSTIGRLENIDLTPAANAAKQALDVSIDNARTALQTALEPRKSGNIFSQMLGDMQGILQRRSAAASGESTLATAKPATLEGIIKAESLANRQALKSDVMDPVMAKNSELIKTIGSQILVIEKSITAMESLVAAYTNGGREDTGSVTGSGRVKEALDFFVKAGFKPHQAAGLVGNLQAESSKDLDPRKKNGIGAYGIAQWLSKDRVQEFVKKFGHDLQQSTFKEQLEFIVHELSTTEKAAGNALRNAQTVEQATLVVRKKYERPGEFEAHDDRRLAYAKQNFKAASETVQQASVPTAPVAATAANDNAVSASEPITVRATNIDWGNTPIVAPNLDWDKSFAFLQESVPKLDMKPLSFQENLDAFNSATATTIANLKALSPEGEVLASVIEGVTATSNSIINCMDQIQKFGITSSEGVIAVAGALSSAVSGIQSAVAATAAAKEAAIQREIDIESKRDGKSAESVAKLAALEKRKDEVAKKQFNTNKKLMMAQAVISTAAGVAGALAAPFGLGIPLAIAIGALGAAQLAIIAGTSYQSSAAASASVDTSSSLTIGKRGDTVDLATQNNNVGGELGYLRGSQGRGSNSGNYSVIGSAYGGDLPRGYGNTAYAVGEKGPEILTADTPISIRPMGSGEGQGNPISAEINIHALDASGVEDILQNQKGNLIAMFREAANANGQPFMESVNTSNYSRPNKTGNSRL